MDTFHLYQDIQARAHVPQLLLGGKFGILFSDILFNFHDLFVEIRTAL